MLSQQKRTNIVGVTATNKTTREDTEMRQEAQSTIKMVALLEDSYSDKWKTRARLKVEARGCKSKPE